MTQFSNLTPTPVGLTEESLESLLIDIAKLPPAAIHRPGMIVSPDIAYVSRTAGIPDDQLTFYQCQIIFRIINEYGRYRAVEEFCRFLALPPEG